MCFSDNTYIHCFVRQPSIIVQRQGVNNSQKQQKVSGNTNMLRIFFPLFCLRNAGWPFGYYQQ